MKKSRMEWNDILWFLGCFYRDFSMRAVPSEIFSGYLTMKYYQNSFFMLTNLKHLKSLKLVREGPRGIRLTWRGLILAHVPFPIYSRLLRIRTGRN